MAFQSFTCANNEVDRNNLKKMIDLWLTDLDQEHNASGKPFAVKATLSEQLDALSRYEVTIFY